MRKKILLVEDYPPNILVAEIFLEQFGYNSEVASNGMQAFEKYKEGGYDLILMDVQMHVMDGLEATTMIREHEHKNGIVRVPVIGMTAHVSDADKDRCYNSGMDDYVAKPFQPDGLRSKIDRFLK